MILRDGHIGSNLWMEEIWGGHGISMQFLWRVETNGVRARSLLVPGTILSSIEEGMGNLDYTDHFFNSDLINDSVYDQEMLHRFHSQLILNHLIGCFPRHLVM